MKSDPKMRFGRGQRRKARGKSAVPTTAAAGRTEPAAPGARAAIAGSPAGAALRSARETVLAQWRGVDLAPLEKAQALVAKRAGDVLPGLLGKLGLEHRQTAAELLKAWPHLVEPKVAAHARPTGLRNGTLFVAVDSSAWLDEIVRYRRKDILDRLRQSFGRSLVTKISFRLG